MIARRWSCGLALVLAFGTPPGVLAAQRPLPAWCTAVTWPASGDVYHPSVLFAPSRSLIADSLLRVLPPNSWSVAGSGLNVLEAVERLWRVDSASVERALSEIISDDREFTAFTAGIAAEAYGQLSGRADPLLSVFTGWGEAPSRLGLVLTALRPPLDTLAQAQVAGYACNAGWILQRSATDPFLRSREAAGHSVFFLADAEGILNDAERLVTGPLRKDVQALVKMSRKEKKD
ncbi:MAG TPA: hypothetical protein VFV65_04345 [Gemmatimonadales bacterium]|nr:hypothetical protein [Gemmatimonadales bacterium]